MDLRSQTEHPSRAWHKIRRVHIQILEGSHKGLGQLRGVSRGLQAREGR